MYGLAINCHAIYITCRKAHMAGQGLDRLPEGHAAIPGRVQETDRPFGQRLQFPPSTTASVTVRFASAAGP